MAQEEKFLSPYAKAYALKYMNCSRKNNVDHHSEPMNSCFVHNCNKLYFSGGLTCHFSTSKQPIRFNR